MTSRALALIGRKTLRSDSMAGLVLGVQSVPDALAAGLLAGVSPVSGLYAAMVGTLVGALATSSAFMTVQTTGAMSTIVADIQAVHRSQDPLTALFTLSVLTGAVMLVAGLLKLGSLLRWVSNAVMIGFINAVGVNIVLAQLANFTGYKGEGGGRVARAIDLIFNLDQVHLQTAAVGLATIALILILGKSRIGPIGLVIAIAATSLAVPLLGWDVLLLSDITEIPRLLPSPVLPSLALVPQLLLPAASLAFVGLVQGAGITSNFPNPDGGHPDASRDFVGQGIANISAGVFQGMPVGGSMSSTSLVKAAGARSRAANVIAGLVMALSILLFAPLVGRIAMPALAGLLIVVGIRTIKPGDIKAMWRTGKTQATVMTVTFALTMLIPLQMAVLVGVGISVILYVIKQSNRVTVKRWLIDDTGRIKEVEAPATIGADEVVVLMPYGSLFFAAAPLFEEALPKVISTTRNSVVVLRLRGKSDIGSTFMEILVRYARALQTASSKLMIVSANERVLEQFQVTGVTNAVGPDNIYEADEWVGATVTRAHDDALVWVSDHKTDLR